MSDHDYGWDDEAEYSECRHCNGGIFMLGGDDRLARFVSIERQFGGGFLHEDCRDGYETENGPVVCEQDDEETEIAKRVQRIEWCAARSRS